MLSSRSHDPDSPIRVLHTVAHLERGGTQRYLLGLHRATRSSGAPIDHVICTFGARDQMLEEFESCGLDVVGIRQVPGLRGRYEAFRRLRRVVHDRQPDVVQCHSRWDRPYAYLAAAAAGIPVINSLHSDYAADYGGARTRSAGVRDLLERRLERRVGGIAVVSPHLAETWSEARGREIPWAWVPPFVADEFVADADPCADPLNEQVRLVTVSRLVPGKGIDLLLEALPMVRDRLGDVHLTVVGDGPEKARLESRTYGLGMADHVRFLGERTDVRNIHKDQHIFVLPTASEGYGIAAVEAVLSGLMVVVTELPSTSLILEGLPNVQFIAGLDRDGVVDAICRAAGRMRSEGWIGIHARRVMLERQSEGTAVQRLLELYRDVVEGHAA